MAVRSVVAFTFVNSGLFPVDILPTPGASEECDEASAAVEQAEGELEDVLEEYKTLLKCVGYHFCRIVDTDRSLLPFPGAQI